MSSDSKSRFEHSFQRLPAPVGILVPEQGEKIGFRDFTLRPLCLLRGGLGLSGLAMLSQLPLPLVLEAGDLSFLLINCATAATAPRAFSWLSE